MAAAAGDISRIVVTTNSAAVAGLLMATATSWIVLKKPDLGMSINGLLAGLVGITAPCAFVGVGSPVVIGAIAGVMVVFSVLGFERWV